jgi:EmrB/QacA subfamily drug resistance transporter
VNAGPTSTPSGVDSSRRTGRIERHWWTLIAVCMATFMLLVDVTIVQVALPTIQRKLGASFSDLQWLISAYALSLSSLILTSGSIADKFGRKRVFLFGLVVFSGASLACGLSTSASMLIAARAVQGIGGAAMFATGLALIGQDFQGPHASKRATAIAIWGATVGGAVAVGPLVGGVLTEALGWQWIFFVNVPIGVVTLALGTTRMVNKADPGATRLDVGGLLTFSGSLFLLVFALVIGNNDGWSSTLVLAMLIGAAVLMAGFVAVELFQKRPMFDLALFRKPSFTGVSFATLMLGAGMFAMFPYITLYLQNDLGYSPLQGGIRLLPATLLTFIVPLAGRRAAERIAPEIGLGAGLAVTGVGIAVMARLAVADTWTVLLPGLVLIGLGIGIANPAVARIALGVVPPERTGMASGINNTFRIGGLSIGVAALGAIFQQRLATGLEQRLGRPVQTLARVVASGGVIQARKLSNGSAVVVSAARHSFASGMNVLFVVGAAMVLAGAIAAFTMVKARDFISTTGAGGGPSDSKSPTGSEAPSDPNVPDVVVTVDLGI